MTLTIAKEIEEVHFHGATISKCPFMPEGWILISCPKGNTVVIVDVNKGGVLSLDSSVSIESIFKTRGL